ncbi:MAG: ferredoxin [Syntrophobacterales bacterium CG_4_8_14_3_um_filter_58_8]|nr:MAG: ferredoxin [Syntrophaceae bacterium CG2_30_58_14]PIV03374.1 MAG: ferredoxin [Syntrophobacterales bacterium CG03_land_8_20_14_0_80_58_14]PJC72626.1 MAG: ferredoxin [Syntrophobacterales bacterium CG_4_8_14_3_um_filter_58_8]
MAKKVHINEDECIECGACEEICPEVFMIDSSSGKATVIKPASGPEDLIEEAIESCPVSCIRWEI